VYDGHGGDGAARVLHRGFGPYFSARIADAKSECEQDALRHAVLYWLYFISLPC
jgi:hypothetical protein